jgi:predicted ribosome quality control (RQC) complex YloA/Tae2 family protein
MLMRLVEATVAKRGVRAEKEDKQDKQGTSKKSSRRKKSWSEFFHGFTGTLAMDWTPLP